MRLYLPGDRKIRPSAACGIEVTAAWTSCQPLDPSGVVTLQAAALNQLVGRRASEVLFDGYIAADPAGETNLAGVNLGVAAFQITGVDSAADTSVVFVRAFDIHESCNGAIGAFNEVP